MDRGTKPYIDTQWKMDGSLSFRKESDFEWSKFGPFHVLQEGFSPLGQKVRVQNAYGMDRKLNSLGVPSSDIPSLKLHF